MCKVQEGDGEFLTRDVAFFAELGQMEFESAEHEEVGGHFVAQVVQFLEDFLTDFFRKVRRGHESVLGEKVEVRGRQETGVRRKSKDYPPASPSPFARGI